MLTGYTTNLPTDTLLNMGVFYYTRSGIPALLGVTLGGADFDPGVELGEIEFEEKPSRLKGLTRRIGFAPVIKGTLLEFGPQASGSQVGVLEGGSTEATASGTTTVTPRAAGSLFAAGEYVVDLRMIFQRASGGYATLYFPLAKVRKYTVTGAPRKNPPIAFEFEAIGDPVNDLSTAPYSIEIRTSPPSIPPTTPSGLFTQFNLAGGGTNGATMLFYGELGVNQTIVANGDGSLPSPATNSPTGYWCTKWDDAITPNAGKHLRPSGDVNGGNGAPCNPVNTGNLALGGTICGRGLEHPDSTGFTGGALFHGDGNTFASSIIPGSGNLAALFSDYSSGITWGGCAKMLSGDRTVVVGEDSDTNRVELFGDDFGNIPGLRNSTMWDDGVNSGANRNAGGVFGTGGTPIMHFFNHVNQTAETTEAGHVGAGHYWQVRGYGRDMVWFQSANDNAMAAGRRVRVLADSYTGIQRALSAYYVLKGHCNSTQTKLLCDYFDLKFSTFNDTRRIGYLFGDSEYTMHIALPNDWMLVQGPDNGAPAITNFGIFPIAFSGMRPQSNLYPFYYYLAACDFSKRPTGGVAIYASEFLNASPYNETVPNTLAQNYWWMDRLRALDPTRVRIAMHNWTYHSNEAGFGSQQSVNEPTMSTDLAANAVSGGHANVLVDYLRSVMFNTDTEFYGTGLFGRTNLIWDGIHPFDVMQRALRARIRAGMRAALGEDVSNVTVEVYASTPKVSLTAGAPTATPTWTAKSSTNATLSKTLSFTSTDPTIATVNASSGLITRIAVGKCVVEAVADDGGRGVCVVVCT